MDPNDLNKDEASSRGRLQDLLNIMFGKGKYDVSDAIINYGVSSLSESIQIPSPPGHWKECERCKVVSFQTQLNRVLDGHLRDLDGDYYSPEWLNALMLDAADSESFEIAEKIKEAKSIMEGLIANAGLEIPIENFY